jgi:O-methyltransferase
MDVLSCTRWNAGTQGPQTLSTGEIRSHCQIRRQGLASRGRDNDRPQAFGQLHACIETVIRDQTAGDLIETGVWRGGACIFMRAALNAYGDRTRKIWVADSFEGLPKPDGRYRQDDLGINWTFSHTLGVSLDQVKANFSRYGLLDERVRFLKGWFKDTLPAAPIERLAILRLDGDMYSSTMDALVSLYPKLSCGGFAIIDDYGVIEACRKAVADFRDSNKINDPILPIDGAGV